jgi:hypothetical protein
MNPNWIADASDLNGVTAEVELTKWSETIVRHVDLNEHYHRLRHEPIFVMREWLTKEQYIGFCLGNVIKYLGRYNAEGKKGGPLNLEKALDYLEWAIGREADTSKS